MKSTVEKDEVYLLTQPKKGSILSIVVIEHSTKFPLSEEEHQSLVNLAQRTDLMFIFSNSICPDLIEVKKNKFSSLIGAFGFIDSGPDLVKSLFTALSYEMEVTNGHSSILFGSTGGDRKLEMGNLDNLLKVSGSPLAASVYVPERLTALEAYEIYNKEWTEPVVDIKGVFKKAYNQLLGKEEPINVLDQQGMWTTHKTNSEWVFMRRFTVKNLLDFLYENEAYLASFSEQADARFFLASLINKLGLPVFHGDVFLINSPDIDE